MYFLQILLCRILKIQASKRPTVYTQPYFNISHALQNYHLEIIPFPVSISYVYFLIWLVNFIVCEQSSTSFKVIIQRKAEIGLHYFVYGIGNNEI